MSNAEWVKRGKEVFIGTYNRFPAMMVKGEGCRLWDADGREYLDFLAGIAVCSLGHCHPAVTEAITSQAAELVHVSNLFHMQPQIELAEMLTRHSFADQVFMANSGAEANEAAIKLARIHSPAGRYGVITISGSFHGRTMATLGATAQPKLHEGFEPMLEGFSYAEFGDIKAVERLVTDKTCAVLCEPLQGESGVRPLEDSYLLELRSLCDRHGLLLIFDEIQTGVGRTGSLFAYEQTSVVPDIMTSAKALANGLPLGVMLTTREIASSFGVGSHGSTFGGNPVAAAAATVVLKTVTADGFLESVQEKSRYFIRRLEGLAEEFPQLTSGVRGRGLMLGLMLTDKGIEHGAAIVQSMFEQGVLINFAGNRVLRFVPPLVVTTGEIDQAVAELQAVLKELG